MANPLVCSCWARDGEVQRTEATACHSGPKYGKRFGLLYGTTLHFCPLMRWDLPRWRAAASSRGSSLPRALCVYVRVRMHNVQKTHDNTRTQLGKGCGI